MTQDFDRVAELGRIVRVHKERGWILFMPHDGYCGNCNQDIVAAICAKEYGGYVLEMITGCPLCSATYCD
jgi:hypothetical protein